MSTRRQLAAQRQARLGGRVLDLDSPVLEAVAEDERQQYLEARARLAPLPPTAARSSTSEATWQRQVVQLATRLNFYVYHPKLSRWSERGWPDLSLLGNRALWLECKTDSGQLSEKQVEVFTRMRACGLEVYCVRPWHGIEAVAALLQFGVAIA